jgi:hypothetical protein
MSYLNKYRWILIPQSLPEVIKNCPKCNEKMHFINSEKFRVNANKNNLDIWLIFHCEKCKSTWNMTIYDRINPFDIKKEEYEKFLANDRNLVKQYAFNLSLYTKIKAEVTLNNINYKLISEKLDAIYINEDELVIEMNCKYPMELRIDKLLCDKLLLSRSKIKSLHKSGLIFINDNKNCLTTKVKDGLELHVLKVTENEKLLKAII